MMQIHRIATFFMNRLLELIPEPIDAFAVCQGIKTIKLEVTPPAQPISIDSDAIFNDLENDRTKGLLAENVTSAKIYCEASVEHPGYLDRVNSVTKKRQTGSFENGEFKAL